MARFTRGMKHWGDILQSDLTNFPRRYLDWVMPVMEVLGSTRFSETLGTFFTPQQADFYELQDPTPDFGLVKHASLFIDSTVATTVGFHLRRTVDGLRTNVEDDRSVPPTGADGFEVALLTPVLVPAGFNFGIHVRQALIPPNSTTARFLHLSFPAGEVIPHVLQR